MRKCQDKCCVWCDGPTPIRAISLDECSNYIMLHNQVIQVYSEEMVEITALDSKNFYKLDWLEEFIQSQESAFDLVANAICEHGSKRLNEFYESNPKESDVNHHRFDLDKLITEALTKLHQEFPHFFSVTVNEKTLFAFDKFDLNEDFTPEEKEFFQAIEAEIKRYEFEGE